ncbi:hypothetical protein [Azotobacter salinestris]|uniref:hypothetical protein n=1 Tax=Azotobacter salinestris TaxID=69964 RepID=UPI001266BBE8|nr:hypothetical protein [Azotobacter salinestris]
MANDGVHRWRATERPGDGSVVEVVDAADHDRIVSELVEGGRKMQAERDQWQQEAIRLASVVCALGKMEFDQLTDDTKLIEVMSLIREAIQERDQLAERCRELENQAAADTELIGKYQSTVDDLRAEVEQARGTAEYWKAGLLDANAEVEALRKDADRYRWLRERMAVEDIPGEHPAWSQPSEVESVKVDIAIDVALEASR